jgi:hypothetical protein
MPLTSKTKPVSDTATGKTLFPKDTPGYYPGLSTLAQQKYWDAATRKLVLDRVGEAGVLRFFSQEEARTMRAVCERILPQEDRIEAQRVDILAGIDKRLHENRIDGYRYEDMPSDQHAYRLAASAFGQMARQRYGQDFNELRTLDQEMLIQSIHDGKPSGAGELWKQMNVKRFWTLLIGDCCSIYYAHPYAWDEIGFGGPAYPRGYMRLEDGEAEPWEVREQRYEWSAPSDTISDHEQDPGCRGSDTRVR